MTTTTANEMTLAQIQAMDSKNANAYLRALQGLSKHDADFTPSSARELLKSRAWSNGESLAENEITALEIIANEN